MISKGIKFLYPDAQFIIENENINNIIWVKNKPEGFDFPATPEGEQLKLSKVEELLAASEQATLAEKALSYKDDRRKEYPPIQDLADALYWQSQGDNSKMEEYIAAVNAVKEKYPKG